MKNERKRFRQARFTGYPIRNLVPQQITKVHVGADPGAEEDDHVSVECMLPLDGAVVEYEESILLDEAPHYLRKAAEAMLDAACQAMRERASLRVRNCSTCPGVCCWDYAVIEVTNADVMGMREAGLDVAKLVERLEEPNLRGYTCAMRRVPRMHNGEEIQACIALDENGRCTIYDHRPLTCSDYSEVNCELWEPKGLADGTDEEDDTDPGTDDSGEAPAASER